VVLILLLIALPLYLWPLRGGGAGLPGAAALSGLPRDPRDATAVAQLPADVWDSLMGDGRTGPKGETRQVPGNLTRIARLEGVPGAGPLGIGPGGTGLSWPRDTLPRAITGLSGDNPDPSSGAGDSPSTSAQFLAGPPGGESTGSGNGSGGGSYSGLPNNLGPFNGGGGGGAGGTGGGGPLFVSDPGDPSAPTPTPEPATIFLIGSNVVLLGVASWRRFRSIKKETKPIG
jgi:hypothetical protein